jgi:hypothetical protein
MVISYRPGDNAADIGMDHHVVYWFLRPLSLSPGMVEADPKNNNRFLSRCIYNDTGSYGYCADRCHVNSIKKNKKTIGDVEYTTTKKKQKK